MLRILIADDHPAHLARACEMFKALDCQVQVARNGADAVLMAAITAFDLVLMDRHMPVLGGDDAARMMRMPGAASSGALVVCHSTCEPMGCATGAYDLIVDKPIGAEDVAALVERLRGFDASSHL